LYTDIIYANSGTGCILDRLISGEIGFAEDIDKPIEGGT